jgi:hypothetical protein
MKGEQRMTADDQPGADANAIRDELVAGKKDEKTPGRLRKKCSG